VTAQTGPPPPGWYRDPYAPAGLRWWDGRLWTQHARPPVQPVPRVPPVPPYAGRNERLGRLAMLIWAPVQLGYVGLLGVIVGRVVRDMSRFTEEASTAPPGEIVPFPVDTFALTMVAALAGLLAWIPLALMMFWSHRCATTAAALRIPAARAPFWAIVGWIVPVINLLFPYQSVRDCLPPDHPGRRDVLLWWLGYLAVGFGASVAVLLALVGVTPFLLMLAVLAVLAVATVLLGLRVVTAIDEAHRAALGDATA
jgi:hypothetical protein